MSALHTFALAIWVIAAAMGNAAEETPAGPVTTGRGESQSDTAAAGKEAAVLRAKTYIQRRLSLISDGIRTGHMSAFAYLKPTPGEMLDEISVDVLAGRAGPEGGASRGSQVSSVVSVADRDVIEMYKELASEGTDGEALSKGRAYLSAYLLGTHTIGEYEYLFGFLAEELGNAEFLAEDALKELHAFSTASQVIEAMVHCNMLSQQRYIEMMRVMAESAKTRGEGVWAQYALDRLVNYSAGEESADYLAELIQKVADEAGKKSTRADTLQDIDTSREMYRAAAEACIEFGHRFPSDKRSENFQYRAVVYYFLANAFGEAVSSAHTFGESYPKASLLPNARLTEAMSYSALGNEKAAMAIFQDIITNYAKSEAAGGALYLTGRAHQQNGQLKEAAECFRRVTDFYPKSRYVLDARNALAEIEKRPK